MSTTFLDFEKPIAELQSRIDELRDTTAEGTVDIGAEIAKLQAKSDKLLRDTFAKLTPWQKTQVARHPSGRTSSIISPGCSTNSCRWRVTAHSATIRRSWAASHSFAASASWCWATKRAKIPPAAFGTISAWANPKAIARRSVWSSWPIASAFRS